MTNMSIAMSSEPFQQFPKPRAPLLSATLMSHDPLQQQSPNRSRNWAFPLIYHAQILTLPLTTDLPKNIKESSRGLFFRNCVRKWVLVIKVRKKGGTLSPDLRGSTDKWSFGGKRKIKVKELSVVGLTHKSFITPKSFHFLPTLINNLQKSS